jgi:putative hemolysin
VQICLASAAAVVPHVFSHYPRRESSIPVGVHRAGRYEVRFARDLEDLRKVLRLRFEVFNLELCEGLSESYRTGLDYDAFDARCHHLMVIDHASAELVSLPEQVFRHGAEVGRACVAEAHRNGRVLQLLWRGIARYLDWNDKRYVFGCCSIPTLDLAEIADVSHKLAHASAFHPRFYAAARHEFAPPASDLEARDAGALPPLFASYLKLGATVCGGPALDRAFGVTDYLVLLDLRDVQPRVLANLSAPGLWQTAA